MAEHILVQDIVPRIQYTADGINKTFETPFIIFNEDALDVYLDEEKITQGYTIQMDDEMRGQVVFETAPENGTLITLSRHLTIARTSDFQEGGSLRANTLNYELDYQTACLQELADNINRSMVLPPYAVGSDTQLTLPLPEAGKAIVWDVDGKNLENSELEINKVSQKLEEHLALVEENVSLSEQQAELATEKANLATAQAVLATQKANEAAAKLELAIEAADEAQACVTSKANVDMDNLSAVGCIKVASLSMSSDEYVETSFIQSAIGTYTWTIPANGYFVFVGTTGLGSGSSVSLYFNGNIVDNFSSVGHGFSLKWPFKKGDEVKVTVNVTNLYAIKSQAFYYAQGEV